MSSLSSPLQDTWQFVFHQFCVPGTTILRMQPAAGGFSGDPVIRIETTAGSFALRSWPAADWPIERIRERHRWLQYLQQAGIPVAAPVCVGLTLNTLLVFQERFWQLEPWLPGTAGCRNEMTPHRWRACLHELARIHNHSASYDPTPLGAEWFSVSIGPSPTIRERRRLIASWTPARLSRFNNDLHRGGGPFTQLGSDIIHRFSLYSRQIDSELKRLEAVPVRMFPCFRDLWSAHILFEGDEVTGFIDPTAARAEHVAADLSRLLGSFLGDDRAGWLATLQEYEQARPLTSLDYSLIRIFDRSSVLLSGMTWLARQQAGLIQPAQVEQVLARLRDIAQRSLEESPLPPRS